jgi:Zn-finger nucleic acid-binding protein
MFRRPKPVCQTCRGVLVAFELESVEIDRCAECGGTWLDAGEIERISAMAGVEPGPMSHALTQAASGAQSKRQCPRCGRNLRLVKIGEGKSIEIDRCPAGHGYWFDPGEMRQLIEAFDQGEEGAVAKFFKEMFGAEMRDNGR